VSQRQPADGSIAVIPHRRAAGLEAVVPALPLGFTTAALADAESRLGGLDIHDLARRLKSAAATMAGTVLAVLLFMMTGVWLPFLLASMGTLGSRSGADMRRARTSSRPTIAGPLIRFP
jgi:hypothetical protein